MFDKTKECEHKHTDWSWSDGNLERCLDCGAMNDGGWNSPVQQFYDAVNSNNVGAAHHFGEYMKQAKLQHGIPYPVR